MEAYNNFLAIKEPRSNIDLIGIESKENFDK
jgi:hypothetical protein